LPEIAEPTRQAAILVGGFGTRLGALTQSCPKPLLDIAGEPFLGRLMRHLVRFGCNDFLLLAGYLSEQIEAFAQDFAASQGVQVRVCVEPEPAGTGGALHYARDYLNEEFVLLNGDTMFNFNLLDLGTRPVGFDWQGRMALRAVPDTSRFGRVEHAAGQITAMREKVAGSGAGTINAGVYWLRRSVLDRIERLPCSLEQDVLPALIAEGRLAGFSYDGAFIDIGVPDDLAFAQTRWDEFVARPAVFFDRDGVLNHDDGYTHRVEDFRWTDDAVASIKACNDAGRYVFVVTNQAGVARGLYDEAAVCKLHDWMNVQLRRSGAHIDAFAYCPHHRDGVVREYAVDCACRKPAPGMIEALMSRWPVIREGSFLLGDKDSDIGAAQAACIAGFHVAHGGGDLGAVLGMALN
jgi:D,D-heptose 1,7-bisphosphate phosphatase